MHLDLNADETAEDAVLPVEVRVKQGMMRLDAVHGPAWVHRIDLDSLMIESTCRCILGQLSDTYRQGLREVGLGDAPFEEQVANGFERDLSLTALGSMRDGDALTAEWKVQIARRRLELADRG